MEYSFDNEDNINYYDYTLEKYTLIKSTEIPIDKYDFPTYYDNINKKENIYEIIFTRINKNTNEKTRIIKKIKKTYFKYNIPKDIKERRELNNFGKYIENNSIKEKNQFIYKGQTENSENNIENILIQTNIENILNKQDNKTEINQENENQQIENELYKLPDIKIYSVFINSIYSNDTNYIYNILKENTKEFNSIKLIKVPNSNKNMRIAFVDFYNKKEAEMFLLKKIYINNLAVEIDWSKHTKI